MSPQVAHLVRRFVASIRLTEPTAADEAFLIELLSPSEVELYRAQPLADRVHSIECAESVRGDRSVTPSRDLIVASALHDVGKGGAQLSTSGRVVTTIVGAVAGVDRMRRWHGLGGIRARVAHYRLHDELGADLLADAGSAPIVVAWAREHHRPSARCTIDAPVAEALRRADG